MTVGCFDARHPTIAYVTTSGTELEETIVFKMLSQNCNTPYTDVSSFGGPIVKILAAKLMPRGHELENHDFLAICEAHNLRIFNVLDNCDVAVINLDDEAIDICVGKLNSHGSNLLLFVALSDYLVQGYDFKGDEIFWIITGDVPVCVTFVENSNKNEEFLAVYTEDFSLRFYEDDKYVEEARIKHSVSQMCGLEDKKLGFFMADGTIGVLDAWNSKTPIWEWKSNMKPSCIFASVNSQPGSLIFGYEDGSLEIRYAKDGKLVCSRNLDSSQIVAISEVELDGKINLCAISANGRVHIFVPDSSASRYDIEGVKMIEKFYERKLEIFFEKPQPFSKHTSVPFECKFITVFPSNEEFEEGSYVIVSSQNSHLIHSIIVQSTSANLEDACRFAIPPTNQLAVKLKILNDECKAINVTVKTVWQLRDEDFSSPNQNLRVSQNFETVPALAMFKHIRDKSYNLWLKVKFSVALSNEQFHELLQYHGADVPLDSNITTYNFFHITTRQSVAITKSNKLVTIKWQSYNVQSETIAVDHGILILQLTSRMVRIFSESLDSVPIDLIVDPGSFLCSEFPRQMRTQIETLTSAVEIKHESAQNEVQKLLLRLDSGWDIQDTLGMERDASKVLDIQTTLSAEFKKKTQNLNELVKIKKNYAKTIEALAGLSQHGEP
ncbi:Bardet-Biedl syndrome 2 protein [Entophlyctis sp. JEL0112]|nr:Bardet-Biedl syndrome 2 protein [Entophlyctis sp. JEL0112]